MDKAVWTKWYGQNGIQQNGMERMVWTKWFLTKWYGQHDMNKMVTIFLKILIQLNSINI